MSIVALVQARLGSIRLPNKVLKPINGTPLIDVLIKRLANSKLIDQIIVATTEHERDNKLADHLTTNNVNIFRGSENDVLSRYMGAAKQCGATQSSPQPSLAIQHWGGLLRLPHHAVD